MWDPPQPSCVPRCPITTYNCSPSSQFCIPLDPLYSGPVHPKNTDEESQGPTPPQGGQ